MTAELYAGTGDSVLPPTPVSRPRSSDAFTSTISSGALGQPLLRPVIGWKSHSWAPIGLLSHLRPEPETEIAPAGEMLSPAPAPPTCTAPASPLLPSRDNNAGARQRGVTGLGWDRGAAEKRRLNEIFEAGVKQMWVRGSLWKCCNISPQHLIPCSDISDVEMRSWDWLFYIWYRLAFMSISRSVKYWCKFWAKIISSDYQSPYSVSGSF